MSPPRASAPFRRLAPTVLAAICALLLLGVPEAAGDATVPFTGSVQQGKGAWIKTVTVPQPGQMSATLSWSTTSAVLTLALVDSSGHVLVSDATTASPKTVSAPVDAGTYKVRV